MNTEAHIAPPAIADALRARADASGTVSFADFSELALFHPQEGYYVRQRQRVGLSTETDFYTASSVGPVFGKLVAEAAATLIAPASPQAYTLVEIGAEPGAGVFEKLYPQPATETPPFATSASGTVATASGTTPPTCDTTPSNAAPSASNTTTATLPAFADVRTLPLGHEWHWPQQSVIFANELLDAQPFHRLQLLDGRWREWGVRCDENGRLSETLLDGLSAPVATSLAAELPRNLPEGWRLDISLAAESLFARLLGGNWQGAFMLFDYGKYWQDLLTASPAGTARAYRNHQLSTDLLANPGEQDLTCHVCWDRLEAIAAQHGFATPRLDRQEAFFMRNSAAGIARIIGANPAGFDPERQALMSLLHPTHLGSKFQVLHGVRHG